MTNQFFISYAVCVAGDNRTYLGVHMSREEAPPDGDSEPRSLLGHGSAGPAEVVRSLSARA